jgi:hypothetical protein
MYLSWFQRVAVDVPCGCVVIWLVEKDAEKRIASSTPHWDTMKRSWKTIQCEPNETLTSIAYECGILGTVFEILEQLLPPTPAQLQVVKYTCFSDDDDSTPLNVPATDKSGKFRVEIRLDKGGMTLAGPKSFTDIDEYATVIQELSLVATNWLQLENSNVTPFTKANVFGPKVRRILCYRTASWLRYSLPGNGRR